MATGFGASWNAPPPVIAIDGPSGVGKGTLSQMLALDLGWHYLDSGALYRILAWAALRHALDPEAEGELLSLAGALNVSFARNPDASLEIYLDDACITQAVRTNEVGHFASQIAAKPAVRDALLDWQRRFRQPPGLVADGRDMGTVVFPDAILKIFLTASAEERAKRRQKQLREQGVNVNLAGVVRDIEARDYRDSHRSVAPLKPAVDAVLVDTTGLSVVRSFETLQCLVKAALNNLT